MASRTAILSLGSNMGRREEHILGAVHQLRDAKNLIVRGFSSLFESEPVGVQSAAPFVNAVCVVEAAATPRSLLETCRELERRAGRDRRLFERPLDVDIVLFGDLTVQDEDLVIPHPRFRERLFVLVPLGEVIPDLPLPPDGRTPGEIISRERLAGWIRQISSHGRIAAGGKAGTY